MPRHLPRAEEQRRDGREGIGPIAEFLEGGFHDLVVGAAVVEQAERIAVRHRGFRHQVAPAQFDAVEPAIPRGEIDQAVRSHTSPRVGRRCTVWAR